MASVLVSLRSPWLLFFFAAFTICPALPVSQETQWIALPIALVLASRLALRTGAVSVPIFPLVVFSLAVLWWVARFDVELEGSLKWTLLAFGLLAFFVTGTSLLERRVPGFAWIALWLLLNGAYLIDVEWHWLGRFFHVLPCNQENELQFWNALGILFAGALLRQGLSSGLRNMLIVCLGIAFLSLGISGAKAVQLGAAFAVLLYATTNLKWKWVTILLLCFASLLSIVIPVCASLSVVAWPGGISIASRQDIWSAALRIFWANPWFGSGTASFGAWSPEFWPQVSELRYENLLFPFCAHNWWLNALAEGGVFAGVLLLLQWGVALWGLWHGLRKGDPSAPWWAATMGVVVSVTALTELNQTFPVSAFLVLLVLWYPAWRWWPGRRLPVSRSRAMACLWACGAGILVAVYPVIQEFRVDAMTKNVFLNHSVQGTIDLQTLVHSMEIRPNSVALHYLSSLQLKNGYPEDALRSIDQLQAVSGFRWPVHRSRAIAYAMMGNCPGANEEMRLALRSRTMEQEPELQQVRDRCGALP